jgi:hypothetical protein
MWSARVDCAACHRADAGSHGKPGAAAPAGESACLSCHGTGYAGILPAWKEAFGKSVEAAEAAVAAALGALPAGGEEEAALRDAAHDVALVRADGSGGAHNPVYAASLLKAAHDRAALALRRHAPGTLPPDFPLRHAPTEPASCAACHVGVIAGAGRRPGARFDHGPHLGKGFHCSSCHSTGVPDRAGERHGVVKADCAACHHDAAKPVARERACASCHAEEEAFLQGRRADGTKGEAMMAEVSCDACHGDPVDRPVRAPMKARCIACHDDDASYGPMVDDWGRDAAAWMADAAARLDRTRRAAGGTPAVAAAAERLERLRRARPVHNILLFEEEKEAFDDLVKAAGKGR